MTERYGWDQTPTPDLGLDITKAPADIQKLYKWVVEKMYGKDVASAYGQAMVLTGIMAKNADAMSLFTSGQMDDLKIFVDSMLLEMTNKDIISAPEIIEARGGKPTLGARLDETTQFSNTVSDMLSESYKVGDVIKTLGYHYVNDGGGCLYTVMPIGTPTKSYDIHGTGGAILRPVINGTLHPKMFGTTNDGVALDNFGVQKCFDYSYDLGLTNIDGLNLLYNMGTVNPYDTVIRGWAHTGACVRAGRKLTNFRLKTADGSTNGTCPLGILMANDGQAIYLENITIDGNRLNVSELSEFDGREDGGIHGINIMHEDGVSFAPCGNIYMTNCEVNKVYSYGISLQRPLDCKFVLKDCNFDVHGIAAQAHTTTFEVIGGVVVSNEPRPDKVRDVFHEEMELGGGYTGGKKQTILIDGVKLIGVGEGHNPNLFKVHYGPMAGVAFNKIEMKNCDLGGHSLMQIYNGTTTNLTIDDIEISNIQSPNRLVWLHDAKIEVNNLSINNKKGSITLKQTKVKNLVLDGIEFGAENHITSTYSNIEKMFIKNSLSKDISSSSGILRDSGTQVKKLKINDCFFEQTGNRLFELGSDSIEVNNVTIAPNPTTLLHSTPFIVWQTSSNRLEFVANNILMTGNGYDADQGYFVVGNNKLNGFIYLNNVKHYSVATPTSSVPLASTVKKVLVNCEPLSAT